MTCIFESMLTFASTWVLSMPWFCSITTGADDWGIILNKKRLMVFNDLFVYNFFRLRRTVRSRGEGVHVLLYVPQQHEHLVTAVLLCLVSDAWLDAIQTTRDLRARANHIPDVQLNGSQSLVDSLPKLCDLTSARFNRQVWRCLYPDPFHLWFHWFSKLYQLNKNEH